ncbi:HlyD family secretion protein [Actinobacillus lignieresii]|uniref:RTX-III toxin determinant D n=1 Tax=Actinobacillus lignieresii TaxID=720 RepID=A0A380TZG5_ACTLI|nr:HlyD family efflux transporter periplasmic adaptor subunit [Actinobacillus lignieresii]SUT93422.1 RTX-III toxin determinant D [Actinobacillus lignieresii]
MFRQEAINFHNKKWKCTAVIISSVPSWLVFSVSFILILSFVFFITFTDYTRRTNIVGEIVMQSHPVILSANKSGYISEKYIESHQKVTKGQPLFKITLDRISKSGDTSLNSIQSLQKQIQSIDISIALLRKNETEVLLSLRKQIDNHQKIHKEKSQYLIEIERTLNKYMDLVKKYEKLFKQGYSSNDEVNNQRSRYFSQKSLSDEIKMELIQQESAILNLENEIETQKTNFQNNIIRYELQQNDLRIRLLEFESISELIINAPMDGVIDSISATIGQVIKEGDPLSQISPLNKGKYQLVMWVPNSAISFIKLNDEINIRYEAFPFEKFGQFKGYIRSISSLPASLQELSFYRNLPLETNENIPLYKITAELPDQLITYNDKDLYFMSGMKAEATLFLEKRKLYEWMLFPLYQLTKTMEE